MRSEIRENLRLIVLICQDGRTKAVKSWLATQAIGGVKFSNLNIEGDRNNCRSGDEHAHVRVTAFPSFARAVNVPAAVHQHVGEKDQVTREVHEKPFAATFHRYDLAARDPRIGFDSREAGKNCFE